METSSAPTTLVDRDKLDLSSLIPPKGEMESSFSWTCPFKSPTSSTLCFGEPTLGKLSQETDFYMTKHMPKPSSGANRVSVSHSSLVTKNGEHFYGRTSYMIFPSHGSTSRRLTGETNSSSTTLHVDTCSWKLTGEANSTTRHVDILWLTGKVMKHTLLDTRPQKLIGVHPCPSSILMTYWGEPSLGNGERKRATISGHAKDLCQQQVSREDQLRFKLKIDGDQLDDLISYNLLMEYLEDKTDTGPLEDGLYRFKCIKDHKGPYTSSDPEYNGSSYNMGTTKQYYCK